MSVMRFLVFMLLSGGAYAASKEGEIPPQQVECSGQADTQPLYLGVFLATDFSFRSCSPYKTDSMLQDYLKAFVGGMALYFQETSPAIKVSYLGSRNLTEKEERDILGIKGNEADITVKGADAIKALVEVTINEDFVGYNKLFLVLTGLNITEEETQHKANGNAVIPSSGDSYDEEYDEYMSLSARSGTEKKVFQNVPGWEFKGSSSQLFQVWQSEPWRGGDHLSSVCSAKGERGLSQYGTICGMSSAIVQDFGSNFSGIPSAALQVATVLGPKYKGNISRRTCPEYEPSPTKFHGDECYMISNNDDQETGFDCLDEPIEDAETELMTPNQFYAKYSSWTPCRASYLGSQECQTPNATLYPHRSCKISCCLKLPFQFFTDAYDPIPAPDGEECEKGKICVEGRCVASKTSLGNR